MTPWLRFAPSGSGPSKGIEQAPCLRPWHVGCAHQGEIACAVGSIAGATRAGFSPCVGRSTSPRSSAWTPGPVLRPARSRSVCLLAPIAQGSRVTRREEELAASTKATWVLVCRISLQVPSIDQGETRPIQCVVNVEDWLCPVRRREWRRRFLMSADFEATRLPGTRGVQGFDDEAGAKIVGCTPR